MITIICGTHRKGARSRIVYKAVVEHLSSQHPELDIQTIDLGELDFQLKGHEYKAETQNDELKKVQERAMINADKFIFVIPEYNGSFPGILKLFIDGVSIREYKATFKGKKALLIGVADGRAGNLRGLDQFASILNHMGTIVFPKKLPLSRVNGLIEKDELVDASTLKILHTIADDFVLF